MEGYYLKITGRENAPEVVIEGEPVMPPVVVWVSRAEITIGRDVTSARIGDVVSPVSNEIGVRKGNIGKQHFRLVSLSAGRVIVVGLKSGGTYVNGRRILAPQRLKEGDKIYVSDLVFTFVAELGRVSAREMETRFEIV